MSKSYVNLQNGSDVIASQVSGSCSGNKAVYKTSGLAISGGSLNIIDFIPLKAPCNYGLEIFMTLRDANNSICSYRQWADVTQNTPGSTIGFSGAAAFIVATFGGTTLAVTKNTTKDSLNFNWTLSGSYTAYQYYVEVTITNPTNF